MYLKMVYKPGLIYFPVFVFSSVIMINIQDCGNAKICSCVMNSKIITYNINFPLVDSIFKTYQCNKGFDSPWHRVQLLRHQIDRFEAI